MFGSGNKKKIESLEAEASKLKAEIDRLKKEQVALVNKVVVAEEKAVKADTIINDYGTVNGYINSLGGNANVAVMLQLVNAVQSLNQQSERTADILQYMLNNQASHYENYLSVNWDNVNSAPSTVHFDRNFIVIEDE